MRYRSHLLQNAIDAPVYCANDACVTPRSETPGVNQAYDRPCEKSGVPVVRTIGATGFWNRSSTHYHVSPVAMVGFCTSTKPVNSIHTVDVAVPVVSCVPFISPSAGCKAFITQFAPAAVYASGTSRNFRGSARLDP